MRDYLAPKGRIDSSHLSVTLLQIKERLDTQMDSAVIVAALCDLLIGKNIPTEKELDDEVTQLAKEINKRR